MRSLHVTDQILKKIVFNAIYTLKKSILSYLLHPDLLTTNIAIVQFSGIVHGSVTIVFFLIEDLFENYKLL